MANPTITAGVVPDQTALPQSSQQLVNLVASYLQIQGLSSIQGVVVSQTIPAVSDQDKVWLQLDPATGAPMSLKVYRGGWTALPLVIPNGPQDPSAPYPYQLFYNSTSKILKLFNGTAWTTQLFPSGATASRPPSSVPVNFVFFDTDISKMLRMTSQGWTTMEGGIGEVRMLSGVTTNDAVLQWPGWQVFTAIQGKFPIAQDGTTFNPDQSGGKDNFAWSATTGSAQGGSRDTGHLTSISIDGTSVAGTAQDGGSRPSQSVNGTVKVMPPWYALVFIKKVY